MKYFCQLQNYLYYLIRNKENLQYQFYFIYQQIQEYQKFIGPITHFLKYFEFLNHLLPLRIHILPDLLQLHLFLLLFLLYLECFEAVIFVNYDFVLPLQVVIYPPYFFLNYFQNFKCCANHFDCLHLKQTFYLMFKSLIDHQFYLIKIFCCQIRTSLDYFNFQFFINNLLDFSNNYYFYLY